MGVRFKFDETSRMSPQLKDASIPTIGYHKSQDEERLIIIFNDLFRTSVRSGERSLIDYINNIELGNDIYLYLINNSYDYSNLNENDINVLNIFVSHLSVLYDNLNINNKVDIKGLSLDEKIKTLAEYFKPTDRYSLKDRIVRSFCYYAGISSFEQLKELIISSKYEQQERIDSLVAQMEENDNTIKLEHGDFVRAIGDITALSGSLGNGNFCKEHLGVISGKSDSDTTPLDVDFSYINHGENIYESISGTPTGFGFGNIFIVIKKDNPNISITRDFESNLTGAIYNPYKLEMFSTKVAAGGYETHWGVRTGLSLADVDYIIYKQKRNINEVTPYVDGKVNYVDDDKSKGADLPLIKYEIAKNGYYIPVVDFAGKLIFTKE